MEQSGVVETSDDPERFEATLENASFLWPGLKIKP